MCGQGYYRFFDAKITQTLCSFQTVHAGHLQIHEDQVKAGMSDFLQRLGTTGGNVGFVPKRTEHAGSEFLIEAVIVDDQYPEPMNFLVGDLRDEIFCSRGECECQLEGCALASFTVQVKLTTEQLHQTLGYGQAQPGTAKVALVGGINLGEGFHDALLVGRADTHSRVLDVDAYSHAVIGNVEGFCANANRALFGELDGIADQIEQDLAQAVRITDEKIGKG